MKGASGGLALCPHPAPLRERLLAGEGREDLSPHFARAFSGDVETYANSYREALLLEARATIAGESRDDLCVLRLVVGWWLRLSANGAANVASVF